MSTPTTATSDIILVMDGPIIRTFQSPDGTIKKYLFRIWTTREILVVLAEIRNKRVEAIKKALNAVTPPDDPQKWAQFQIQKAFTIAQEETKRIDPYEAHSYLVGDLEGVDRCLKQSLMKKSSVSEEEAQGVVDNMRVDTKSNLAFDVAGIAIRAVVPAAPAQQTYTGHGKDGMGFGDQVAAPQQVKTFGDAPAPTEPAKAGQ